MPKKKKEEIKEVEVKKVKKPACPYCKAESIKPERKTIKKCLSCGNRFQ